ncbi:putative oxidoreductase [Mucilaginibacter sp. OK268]|jgi:putative oxidoreductase|uniref:DoxX family protein n=1 Tax=Mucilaginibacter sp. OK268 TaxID=1881048 RepID=UPI00088A5778|nr:DoxX family protein [Mucilaginibacter sp. OK268]SDP96561.1 putative oxidoreductase [Mucilaginibacter sp. OK268]
MKNIRNTIFSTSGNWPAAISRLTLGFILLPHGAQKLLGLFGGMGFANTMQYFTGVVHLPWLIGFIVIVIEFAGSILLIMGWATRIIAALIIPLFIGIIITHHWQAGFFMDWFGTNPKGFEGFEFDLLMIGLAISLVISGGGRFSVDHRYLNTPEK